MNKKVLAALSAALILASPSWSDDSTAQEVGKAIESLNKAFAKGDAKAMKALMAADHVAVTAYYGGPRTRDEQLKNLPDLKITEYKAGKMQVSLLGKDAALIRYPLTQTGTWKGKEIPRKSYASAIWVRRDGKWFERFYQETSLDPRP
jgi:hypothetical protein